MNFTKPKLLIIVIMFVGIFTLNDAVRAVIPGVAGPSFYLTAKEGHIYGGDGLTLKTWGFAYEDGPMQYPGPTMIVQEGDNVSIALNNQLEYPVSIVFPGQTDVTASLGVPGLVTREAPPGGWVVYEFTADHPGTFLYRSGTRPDLQTEMGLVGALIVRPSLGDNYVYNHEDSYFDREYLFLFTEMDLQIHNLVDIGLMELVDTTTFDPVYWFINGRNAPDTMLMPNVPWMPSQPYNCMPRIHPGEKLLMRIIGAGRDTHPYHTHGQHMRVIGVDGRMLESAPGMGTDLSELAFTYTVVPGGTADAIYVWTGENLGWDIYGHEQDIDNPPTGNFPGPEDVDHDGDGEFDNVPMEPGEYAPDHGKPLPVLLPEPQDIAFGSSWSGSPFLGTFGYIPPGQGGFNLNAGYFYMWHSHNEVEMVNNDIFPGGNMTMLIVEHPDVPIP